MHPSVRCARICCRQRRERIRRLSCCTCAAPGISPLSLVLSLRAQSHHRGLVTRRHLLHRTSVVRQNHGTFQTFSLPHVSGKLYVRKLRKLVIQLRRFVPAISSQIARQRSMSSVVRATLQMSAHCSIRKSEREPSLRLHRVTVVAATYDVTSTFLTPPLRNNVGLNRRGSSFACNSPAALELRRETAFHRSQLAQTDFDLSRRKKRPGSYQTIRIRAATPETCAVSRRTTLPRDSTTVDRIRDQLFTPVPDLQ